MKKAVTIGGYVGLALVIAGAFLYSTEAARRMYALISLIIGAGLLATFVIVEWGQVKGVLGMRTTRYGANAAALILILVGILTFANLIGVRYAKRIDLTSAKRFSLSDLTLNVLNGLKQDIKVVAFYRPTGAEAQSRRELEDLLNQYRYHSRRIVYEFIDPDKEPARAKQYNITTYGTAIFESGGKTERITGSNEEQITNALVKVTREKQKMICFIEGHGEHGIDDTDKSGLSQVKQEITDKGYAVQKLFLLESPTISDSCNVVVIAGPKKDLLPPEQQAIADYLNRGGKALFLLDPDFPEKTADLSGLLSEWNVKLGQNIVVDVSGVGRMFGMGELAPAVGGYVSHAITRDFNTASFFPLVRSVDPGDSKGDTLQIQSLAQTSERSWADLNPPKGKDQPIKFDATDLRGPISIAVAATAVPKGLPRKDPSSLTPQEMALEPEKHEVKTRLVVIGNSMFATNTFFGLAGNGDFLMNCLNWLAEEEDLIAIRPKSPDVRLAQISLSQMKTIFYVTVIVFPMIVLIAGGVVWWKRR
ncbi:MAG: GldG family protein [Candidatus Latescibacteria bacterium]|nr:GldG family protein [Candidatus Latescibacterota bacterium]